MTAQRPLKGLMDLTDRFSHLPLPLLLTAWLLAVALVGHIGHAAWAVIGFGSLTLLDGLILAALPRFQRSFGPPQLPWLALLTLRLALAAIPWLPLFLIAQLGLSLIATYACWIEPMRLGVTHLTLYSPHLDGCPPLRLLHISDLHVERITDRERRLLALVAQLSPDIILLTGDYLNISYTWDETAHQQTRALLSQLCAPYGVYAIKGSPAVDPPSVLAHLLNQPHITWLRDQAVTLDWHGRRLHIIGVECSYDIQADTRKLRSLLDGRPDDAFTLLLYHTPDVMPAAAQAGVHLYLAGHTHGGQLRLPGLGALVTASIYWKRYEMGKYQQGDTTLYVSRGVGLEGKGVPRARFLCPPEITLFTLKGTDLKPLARPRPGRTAEPLTTARPSGTGAAKAAADLRTALPCPPPAPGATKSAGDARGRASRADTAAKAATAPHTASRQPGGAPGSTLAPRP